MQDYEPRWIRRSFPTVTSLGKSLEQVRCDIRFVFEVSVQTEIGSPLSLNVPVRCAKMGRYNNRNLEHGGHGRLNNLWDLVQNPDLQPPRSGATSSHLTTLPIAPSLSQ